MPSPEPVRSTHFIRNIIQEDLQSGKHQQIVTRFPPEPNGYLHIGHAKSIFLNFGLVKEFPGHCFMRFDDTNPINEDEEYVQAILEDVLWLGFDWKDLLTHASDYFQRLYDFAEDLIQQGKAYVDSQSQDSIREQRGTLTEPGTASPFRDRSIAENAHRTEMCTRDVTAAISPSGRVDTHGWTPRMESTGAGLNTQATSGELRSKEQAATGHHRSGPH